jgi:hypothetical protein
MVKTQRNWILKWRRCIRLALDSAPHQRRYSPKGPSRLLCTPGSNADDRIRLLESTTRMDSSMGFRPRTELVDLGGNPEAERDATGYRLAPCNEGFCFRFNGESCIYVGGWDQA